MALVGGAVVLLAWGAAGASQKPSPRVADVREIDVHATPLTYFRTSNKAERDFGRLRFLGGLVMRADAKAFGGYSGIELSPDGKSLLAVSDAGTWLKAQLVSARGKPAGLIRATVGPLRALNSDPLTRPSDRDAEAVRLFDGGLDKGTVLVGFERNERIGFFALTKGAPSAPARYLRPPGRLTFNKGLEAVAAFKNGPMKGSVIAFAEHSLDDKRRHRGWIWRDAKGKAMPVALEATGGFDITDIAFSPDGDLFVLERRFRWSEGVKMRVRRIAAKTLKPGAVLDGDVMISADMSYEIDNMEGLAVHKDARGKVILTIISDNNFNSFLQRTLLLQFAVAD